MTEPLAPTDAWGVTDGYHEASGQWRPTTQATRDALHEAMGAVGDAPPSSWEQPMWFVRPGEHHRLNDPCEITLEDGASLGVVHALPPDLPLGYHDLAPCDGGPVTQLVVTPGSAATPAPAWGISAQLYAARSTRSWGIGDLGDLTMLARWLHAAGGGAILLSPLHADTPARPQEPSPYFASSRRHRSLLAIAIEAVPGAGDLADELAPAIAAGRELNANPRIDRDAVLALKLPALASLHARFLERATVERTTFEHWRAERGDDLERFAVYSALTELYGPTWSSWPTALRRPDGNAFDAVARQVAPRADFHAWCQWVLDGQVAAAADTGVGLIGDLAVGFRPDGFDAWCDQDLLALDCRVGAPPDGFSPSGQDWGLPPYVPWNLRAARYRPFIDALRANLSHFRGLRIDHVMGLFRLYWIPPGHAASAGAYVRNAHRDLLDLLTLEAARAGAFVVGEDLGTVEPFVSDELAARHLLGCRLAWFERQPPSAWPVTALATVTTHDLPTVAGVWTGADTVLRRRAGVTVDPDALPWFRSRVTAATALSEGAPLADVLVELHRSLAASPSLLRLATTDDLGAAIEPPNVPGTVDERPNWRIPLPLTIEQLTVDPLAARIVASMADGDADRAQASGDTATVTSTSTSPTTITSITTTSPAATPPAIEDPQR